MATDEDDMFSGAESHSRSRVMATDEASVTLSDPVQRARLVNGFSRFLGYGLVPSFVGLRWVLLEILCKLVSLVDEVDGLRWMQKIEISTIHKGTTDKKDNA
uniref:Uncharacterized protein n=1 Tax=Salix viminalis TaxID=40686 RepID=A0A6N2NFG4_SALVM